MAGAGAPPPRMSVRHVLGSPPTAAAAATAARERARERCAQRVRAIRDAARRQKRTPAAAATTLEDDEEMARDDADSLAVLVDADEDAAAMGLDVWDEAAAEAAIRLAVAEEMNAMWAEQRAIAGSDDDPLAPPNGFASAQDYAAYLDAAVREELAQTDDGRWAQQEADEAAAVDALVEAHLGEDMVVCPQCMVRAVRLHQGALVCACGLRLALGQDAWTLPQVGQRLREASEQHSEGCTAVPVFHVARFGLAGLDGLLLECAACHTSSLVL